MSAILAHPNLSAKPAAVYRGELTPAGALVTVDGEILDVGPSAGLRLFRLGFDWGASDRAANGGRQLALALLLDATGDPREAQRAYQGFHLGVVSRWRRQAWEITGREVLAWLAAFRQPAAGPGAA